LTCRPSNPVTRVSSLIQLQESDAKQTCPQESSSFYAISLNVIFIEYLTLSFSLVISGNWLCKRYPEKIERKRERLAQYIVEKQDNIIKYNKERRLAMAMTFLM